MRLISGEEKLSGYIYYSFTAEGLIERSGVTRGLPNAKFTGNGDVSKWHQPQNKQTKEHSLYQRTLKLQGQNI